MILQTFQVISGRWKDDNERLFAMEPLFTVDDFASSGAQTQDARLVAQCLTH